MNSPRPTMKTKTTSLTSLWLLLVLILGLLSQEIQAGVVNQKSGKPKNSTVVSKETSTSSGKSKHASKSKSSTTTTTTNNTTTTTTTSTTVRPPKLDTVTSKLPEIDIDGRHAYINNQYVADQEVMAPDNTPALYDIIQQQMENVLSNTGLSAQVFNDNPLQAKEMMDSNANAPGKPLFGYNMNQFSDYDEESENGQELTEQDEQQNENCEDTEESLSENDDNNASYGIAGPGPSPSASYKPSQSNKPAKDPYDSSNYSPQNQNVPDTGYGQSSKPLSSSYTHSKPPTQPQSPYGQTSQNQQMSKPPAERPKPSYSNKPTQGATSSAASTTKPHHKPHATHKPTKQSPSLPAANNNYANQPIQQSVNKPYEMSVSKPARPMTPLDNGNTHSNSGTPFSTPPSGGTSNGGSTQSKRRHVTFRTVSSSTQFVSTPLADLMLKFSIGMAKKSKSASEDNQIYDKNDIEMTS